LKESNEKLQLNFKNLEVQFQESQASADALLSKIEQSKASGDIQR